MLLDRTNQTPQGKINVVQWKLRQPIEKGSMRLMSHKMQVDQSLRTGVTSEW